VGYDKGARNKVNGIAKDDKQQNIDSAFSLAYPFNRYSGFNFGYLATRTQESVGLDSDTLSAALSLAW
jgi:hypothetical protein